MIKIEKARKYARCVCCFANEEKTKLYELQLSSEYSTCTQCTTLCLDCLQKINIEIIKAVKNDR